MTPMRPNKIADYPRHASIHALVDEQAAAAPDRIAVVAGDESITYRQLIERSKQIARTLVARSVRPGDLVGVCVERTTDAVATLLGVLRAGAAYVPLDPEYPADRLRYMVEDSGAKLVVGHESLSELTRTLGTEVVELHATLTDVDAENQLRFTSDPATHIAYVIYTSGSTGKPKGVKVQHQAVVNFLHAMREQPGITPDDVFLAMTTLSFDISVLEVFLPLVAGACVAMVSRKVARDGRGLAEAVKRHGVTIMQATPSTWRFVLESGWEGGGQGFKILSGGEPLSADLIRPLLERCDELWNLYGPTETTVYSTVFEVTDPNASILVGKPINNTSLLILDEQGRPLGANAEGELLIGGEGVTLGYHEREDLTADRFVFVDGERYYRTGDLAKFTDDEQVECLGRIDSQVKLHGHRIELGEIDAALASHPTIRRAATTVREDRPGDRRLVGYVIPTKDATLARTEVLEFVAQSLPAYMIPGLLVEVDEFPFTPSGKLDRSRLPKPSGERPRISAEFVPAGNKQEADCATIWCEVLGIDEVGLQDNFFELGGNSILALQALNRLESQLGIHISAAEFFDRPTIQAQLAGAREISMENAAVDSASAGGEFAIVGMAARFPGAADVNEFWDNLCNGVESISFFEPEELDGSLNPVLTGDPNYVAARGVVENATCFDADFFGTSPREAALIDPQQRLLLELAWETLEDAGCDPNRFAGAIGIWAGAYQTTYLTKNLLTNSDIVEQVGEFTLGVYNEKDYIASRIAHKLNLRGPAVNVNTACSTSLVAVIEACNNLALGRCDLALAGGVSVVFPQNSGHLFQEGSILSPDGHCRPFDEDAAGTLFGDGAGLVALKRLEDAQRDGDQIYAIVKGFGINNDGSDKASFTAPSIEGQANAIAQAHKTAGITADSIGYVEAHGTATPIGDPIEVAALQRVFEAKTDSKQFCYLGSVKSNIGHAVAAAGVAGLIKTTLALRCERIPQTLHYSKPNPRIDFVDSPFRVCDRLTDWPRTDQPRRAGVSSFGVGGTNAHLVLEEAPLPLQATEPLPLPAQALLLSAKSAEALDQQVAAIADRMDRETQVVTARPSSLEPSALRLNEAAYTLQTGRRELTHRAFFVARGADEAVTVLREKPRNKYGAGRHAGKERPIAFMFPGQGAQYLGMGRNLYQHSQVFREALEECDRHLKPHLSAGLLDVLFAEKSDDATARLQDTAITQPAMFALSYANAQLWHSFGVRAAALIGHSIGEFVAACVAGVMTLSDACRLIAERGRAMSALPAGSMLSVRAPAEQVEPHLSGDLVIASYNSPKLCVVAGPTDQIDALVDQLTDQHLAAKKLFTSHAFHSPMMDSIVAPFERIVSEVELRIPSTPIYSTVTGARLSDGEAVDPAYWANHLRLPVRFAGALAAAWNDIPEAAMVELGPRKTLTSLAKQVAGKGSNRIAVPTLSDTFENDVEWQSTMYAIGTLWVAGATFDWQALHPEAPTKVALPTYPFARTHHFIAPQSDLAFRESSARSTASRRQTSTADSASILSPEPLVARTPAEAGTTSALASNSQPVHETWGGTIDRQNVPKVNMIASTRKLQIIAAINQVFETTSGYDLTEFEPDATFFEMGMDSLVLTQAAAAMKREFGVDVSFRQMLEETPTAEALCDFLDQRLPAECFSQENIEQENFDSSEQNSDTETVALADSISDLRFGTSSAADPTTTIIIQAQLELMQQQLQVLGAANSNGPGVAREQSVAPKMSPPASLESEISNSDPSQSDQTKKTFGAGARVKLNADELPDHMQSALDKFIADYVARMPSSRQYAQTHRRYFADPRTVSGFRPNIKEMTFPIVVNKSKGGYVWDLDGNKYIDVTSGFGSNFLGHSPDFMIKALSEQLEAGYEIGPQTPSAGEAAALFCELTRAERVAFCNTGSEAVLGALRLARTYTGRDKFVMFTGDYHGILDEVIVRGNKNLKTFPAATGVPASNVQNAVVLEYGSEESLRYIEEHLDEFAAVLVEPVQSRRPEFQPADFLRALGRITEDSDTALIFDEVITGFRICAGGAQEYFGVTADLATYGKVVGGGMPIGAVAGKAKYMDGLDGGYWEFGDQSKPEVGMTYFAGTFVRHPLAMAASKAILGFIQREGQPVYDRLNGLTARLAREINAMLQELSAPIFFAHFGSLFKVQFERELEWGELLFAALRLRGIHIWDHRPCLLTVAHTDQDVDRIVAAFRSALMELQHSGFIPGDPPATTIEVATKVESTVEAKLGRDREGNPGWFVPDCNNPGQFLQVPGPV